MSERESWEKELEALGRDSAAEGAEPVETAAGETDVYKRQILRRLRGSGTPGRTEKAKPWACSGSW